MDRLVLLPRAPLALGIAVIAAWAACTIAAETPGASAPAGQPAAARAAVAGDPDVLGAERLFSAWMEGQIAYRGLPGIVVGVVSDQELVWAKGFGFADVNAKVPMTPATKFRMASHSKLFTAIAIMQLREQGKLRLDDPVVELSPMVQGQAGRRRRRRRSRSSSFSRTARACSAKPGTTGRRSSSRRPTSSGTSTPIGRRRSRRRCGGSTPTSPTPSRAWSSNRSAASGGPTTSIATSSSRSGMTRVQRGQERAGARRAVRPPHAGRNPRGASLRRRARHGGGHRHHVEPSKTWRSSSRPSSAAARAAGRRS